MSNIADLCQLEVSKNDKRVVWKWESLKGGFYDRFRRKNYELEVMVYVAMYTVERVELIGN